jgi:hypothetical protein
MRWLETIIVFIVVRVLWFAGSLTGLAVVAVLVAGNLSRGAARHHSAGPGGRLPIHDLLEPEFWYLMTTVALVIGLFGPGIRTRRRNRGRGMLEEIKAQSVIRPWKRVADSAPTENARPEDRALHE